MAITDTTRFLHDTAQRARAAGEPQFALWLDTAATDAEADTTAALVDDVLHKAVDDATAWVAAHARMAVHA